MKNNKHVTVGELEIPVDYFKFTKKEKDELCSTVMDAMLLLIEKNITPNVDRLKVLDRLIESSIITNTEDEKYEICAVLQDIRTLLNEQND